jgi:hypothetical protein
MSVRRIALAGALGAGLLWPACGSAQVAASAPAANPAANASIGHAFAKAATLNIGIAAASMTIFSIGTASLAAGGVLTAGALVIGFTVYPANEYLWDRFAANTNDNSVKAFDTSASLWRTTYKYVTFKVAASVSKFSWLYLYTGSVASTMVMGTVSSLAFPAIFYANGVGWDWYDWYNSSPGKAG